MDGTSEITSMRFQKRLILVKKNHFILQKFLPTIVHAVVQGACTKAESQQRVITDTL